METKETMPETMDRSPRGGLTWSETLEKIAPAFVAVQKEVEDPPRSGRNPHFGSSYVTLEDLIHAVRPVLSEHGVTLIQAPGMEDGQVTVETLLLHESGEWVRSTARSPAQRADPQGVGSAITYLRRYSLAAMLGIAHEADDDANTASSPSRSRPSEKRENGDGGHTCIDPDATLGFGKHKDKTWQEVADSESGYIDWLMGQEDQDRLCEDCLEALGVAEGEDFNWADPLEDFPELVNTLGELEELDAEKAANARAWLEGNVDGLRDNPQAVSKAVDRLEQRISEARGETDEDETPKARVMALMEEMYAGNPAKDPDAMLRLLAKDCDGLSYETEKWKPDTWAWVLERLEKHGTDFVEDPGAYVEEALL